jgi:hypothetical protein
MFVSEKHSGAAAEQSASQTEPSHHTKIAHRVRAEIILNFFADQLDRDV